MNFMLKSHDAAKEIYDLIVKSGKDFGLTHCGMLIQWIQ